MQAKNIIYMGADEAIFEDIKTFYGQALKEFKTVKATYSEGAVLNCIAEHSPILIMLDNIAAMSSLESELRLVKNNLCFKSLVVVVLCKDQEEVNQNKHLLTLGVVAYYVKGGDLETFLKDCLYFALDLKVKMIRFATAGNLDISLKIGICSTITAVSADTFIVETDVALKEEEARILQVPFYDHPELPFRSLQQFPSAVSYPVFEAYELSYPFAGPWDELTVDTIPKEAIETWLERLKDNLEAPRSVVCVFTRNFNQICHAALKEREDLEITLFDSIHSRSNYYLEIKKPSLIILDLEADDSFHTYDELVSKIKMTTEYHPILILLQAPSSSEALKKLYQYDKLIASTCSLTEDLFVKLLSKYSVKTEAPEGVHQYLKVSEKSRAVSVRGEIQLTSLSEHEITFTSELEIPMFSSIELLLPVATFVIIVPPVYEIKKFSGKTHYMGILHGLDEGGLTKLRKIVNQIIYKPVPEFTTEIISQLLMQKPAAVTVGKTTLEELPAAPTKSDEAPIELIRKNTSTTRSKL